MKIYAQYMESKLKYGRFRKEARDTETTDNAEETGKKKLR